MPVQAQLGSAAAETPNARPRSLSLEKSSEDPITLKATTDPRLTIPLPEPPSNAPPNTLEPWQVLRWHRADPAMPLSRYIVNNGSFEISGADGGQDKEKPQAVRTANIVAARGMGSLSNKCLTPKKLTNTK